MNYERMTNMELLRQLITEAGPELEMQRIAQAPVYAEIDRRRQLAKKEGRVWDALACLDGAF